MEETARIKNPKRVEAGRKLAEKNKEIQEFYIKNTTVFSNTGYFERFAVSNKNVAAFNLA